MPEQKSCDLQLLRADWHSEHPSLTITLCSRSAPPRSAKVKLIAQLDDCHRSSRHEKLRVQLHDREFQLCLPRGSLAASVCLRTADGLECSALFTRESKLVCKEPEQEIVHRLLKLPLFEGVSCGIVQRIVCGSRLRSFPDGAQLIEANTPVQPNVFIVFSGQVSVAVIELPEAIAALSRALDGQQVAELGVGQLFGEQAQLVGSAVSLANVCADGPATLLVIPKSVFFAALADSRNLALNLLRVVEKRLLATSQILASD